MTINEEEFRKAVRSLILRGTYPDHTSIRRLAGVPSWQNRSGLKGQQTRWRIEEMEKAGYDWDASKRSQKLVKQTP
jgi:hypothetical protein